MAPMSALPCHAIRFPFMSITFNITVTILQIAQQNRDVAIIEEEGEEEGTEEGEEEESNQYELNKEE